MRFTIANPEVGLSDAAIDVIAVFLVGVAIRRVEERLKKERGGTAGEAEG